MEVSSFRYYMFPPRSHKRYMHGTSSLAMQHVRLPFIRHKQGKERNLRESVRTTHRAALVMVIWNVTTYLVKIYSISGVPRDKTCSLVRN